MQSFNFDIQYRPGSKMSHVDFFSRNPLPLKMSSQVPIKRVQLSEITENWLLAEQQRDPETSSIISKIQNDEIEESIAKSYELRSKMLFRKIQRSGKTRCLPVIPRAFRWQTMSMKQLYTLVGKRP